MKHTNTISIYCHKGNQEIFRRDYECENLYAYLLKVSQTYVNYRLGIHTIDGYIGHVRSAKQLTELLIKYEDLTLVDGKTLYEFHISNWKKTKRAIEREETTWNSITKTQLYKKRKQLNLFYHEKPTQKLTGRR